MIAYGEHTSLLKEDPVVEPAYIKELVLSWVTCTPFVVAMFQEDFRSS